MATQATLTKRTPTILQAEPEPVPLTYTESVKAPESLPTDQDNLAALAYRLWEERGCPEGSPEEDWFQAERQLQLRSVAP
jgi:hypothetical protein